MTHGRSGRPWRRIREQVLARDPYCMIRGPRCTRISTTVDHIVPLSVDPSLAHELSNLRGACAACNYRGGARITNARRQRLPAPRAPQSIDCQWSRDKPNVLCIRQCDGFPLPTGCRRETALRF
jgi:5-methylcytosine-specific restriction endonuclease McrA